METTFGDYGTLVILVAVGVVCAACDVLTMRIPNWVPFVGIAFLCVLRAWQSPRELVLVAVHGSVGFVAFLFLRRVSGRGLGLGDAKLSAFLAAALGPVDWVVAVFVASLAGLAFSLPMLARGSISRSTPLPFAPFLALGGVAAWFLSDVVSRIAFGT